MSYLIAAMLATAVASLASYGGDNERWVRFALGVILAAAASKAIFNTVGGITLPEITVDDALEYGEDAHVEALAKAFSDGIRSELCGRFLLDSSEVYVSVDGFDSINMRAEHIRVVLTGEALGTDFRGVRAFVNENFGECEVSLGFG